MFRGVLHTSTMIFSIRHKKPPKCDAFFRAFAAEHWPAILFPDPYLKIRKRMAGQCSAAKARRRRHGASYSMTCTEIQIGTQVDCETLQPGFFSFLSLTKQVN